MRVFANMAPIFHVLYWEGGHRYGINFDASNSPSICKDCGNVLRISASRLDNFHSALRSCGKEKGCTAPTIQYSNSLHILKTSLSNLSGRYKAVSELSNNMKGSFSHDPNRNSLSVTPPDRNFTMMLNCGHLISYLLG